MDFTLIDVAIVFLLLTSLSGFILLNKRFSALESLKTRADERQSLLENHMARFESTLAGFKEEVTKTFHAHQLESLKSMQSALSQGMNDTSKRLLEALTLQSKHVSEGVSKLTETTDKRLQAISEEVDKRLNKGFEKTTQTFTDIVKRLALIDEAQKKITELSTNVVQLQDILADKRSRGAFGEVQLKALIENTMPSAHYQFQYTMSNQKRVDCMLFLPKPTGHVPIDAKFPLESYQLFTRFEISDVERTKYRQQFRQDIKKHVDDIASKYIIKEETGNGAMMYIPAESIFAEINANYPDLAEYARKHHVWMVSPTTLMAILTCAMAVIKDIATQKQVHIIQRHLGALAKDFDRFQTRFGNLAKHIEQASSDVQQVGISASKIVRRFEQIEQVELEQLEEDEVSADQLESA